MDSIMFKNIPKPVYYTRVLFFNYLDPSKINRALKFIIRDTLKKIQLQL